MSLIYSLAILLYGLAIRLAALFNPKARKWIRGRRGLNERLREVAKDKSEKTWFHVASLGEFEQARPLIERYRTLHPTRKILISFFSPSGYEIRKNYTGAEYILYLPLDTPGNARFFLNSVQPVEIFFVKYEFWFNFLAEIQKRSIPHFLVSGIFRPQQHFFAWYGGWFVNRLKRFTHLFVQNEESLKLLQQLGIKHATLSGDTRYDQVSRIAAAHRELPVIEQFKQSEVLLVGGSTWPPEEAMLAALYQDAPAGFKLIVAPHEIGKAHCDAIRESFGARAILYSEAVNGSNYTDKRVLIIDNIGMLSSIYAYASIAVVGGGFKTGLHNVLEPAAFHIPVVFGPNYAKFDEAGLLLAYQGGFSVSSTDEMLACLRKLMTDEPYRQSAGENAGRLIAEQRGASDRIFQQLEHIKQLANSSS